MYMYIYIYRKRPSIYIYIYYTGPAAATIGNDWPSRLLNRFAWHFAHGTADGHNSKGSSIPILLL